MTTSPATIHFDPEVLSLIDEYLASINEGVVSRPMSRSALINTVMRTSMTIIRAKMPDMERYRKATGLEDPIDVHRRFIEEVLPMEVHKLTER
jgi:hypothetical protein